MKCRETETWTEQFFNKKWLPTNEIRAYRKLRDNTNTFELQKKGKVHPRTGREGPEGEWRYSRTLSVNSAGG
jgi:hypothetical protein